METARSWLGTPYRHQASRKGAGADCLGLIRGVWRELYGAEPEIVPPYTPDWAEQGEAESLRDAAARRLRSIAPEMAQPGDLLLFRIVDRAPAKHAAIITEPASQGSAAGRIIHAYWGRAVTETSLTPWWLRRCAYAFAFPGVDDRVLDI
ncbi:MAG: NlpC/P60 family protein [Maricaulaceae bacterium]